MTTIRQASRAAIAATVSQILALPTPADAFTLGRLDEIQATARDLLRDHTHESAGQPEDGPQSDLVDYVQSWANTLLLRGQQLTRQAARRSPDSTGAWAR